MKLYFKLRQFGQQAFRQYYQIHPMSGDFEYTHDIHNKYSNTHIEIAHLACSSNKTQQLQG